MPVMPTQAGAAVRTHLVSKSQKCVRGGALFKALLAYFWYFAAPL